MAKFTNMASVTYNSITKNSNTVTGEKITGLEIYKYSSLGTYRFGTLVTFAVSVINSSNTTYHHMELRDDIGYHDKASPLSYIINTYGYFVDGVKPTVLPDRGYPNNPLSRLGMWFGNFDIPAHSTSMFYYELKVNEYAPMEIGSEITSTVYLKGPEVSEMKATNVIKVSNSPDLSLTKELSPTVITPDINEIKYTIKIENYGNTAVKLPTDPTEKCPVITDTLDPPLNITKVLFNSDRWDEGNQFTYDQSSGLFKTTDTVVTVPAATYTRGSFPEPGVSTLEVYGTLIR